MELEYSCEFKYYIITRPPIDLMSDEVWKNEFIAYNTVKKFNDVYGNIIKNMYPFLNAKLACIISFDYVLLNSFLDVEVLKKHKNLIKTYQNKINEMKQYPVYKQLHKFYVKYILGNINHCKYRQIFDKVDKKYIILCKNKKTRFTRYCKVHSRHFHQIKQLIQSVLFDSGTIVLDYLMM